MSNRPALAALFVLLACSGCVGNLLSGGKPDTLYRLDLSASQALSNEAQSARTGVVLLPVSFAPQVEGDRLLTTRGAQASYIKGARWVTAAEGLFTQALDQSFRQRSGTVMLTSPRQPAGASFALQVTVDHYEADYGPSGAQDTSPTIIVEGQAKLYRLADRAVIATLPLRSSRQAEGNRVSMIVDAFSRATLDVAASVVDWTGREIPGR